MAQADFINAQSLFIILLAKCMFSLVNLADIAQRNNHIKHLHFILFPLIEQVFHNLQLCFLIYHVSSIGFPSVKNIFCSLPFSFQ